MVHHPWAAASDMIWHIYSHLYFSSRYGGRDLPSSGEAAPTMGKVPGEFWADWPNFIFQLAAPDVIWHIYYRQCCFTGDGGRDLPSSGEAIGALRVKSLLYGKLAKRSTPFQKTNSMITYFDNHITNTSDVMFK